MNFPIFGVRIILLMTIIASCAFKVQGMSASDSSIIGRNIFVNPVSGSDSASGLSPELTGGHGPFKTIARAIEEARPGDTIHLAKTTYYESAGFYNKSGEPGRPIVLDGHGAIIDGSVPIVPGDWKKVAPGLYRNDVLYEKTLHSGWNFVMRFALVIDGVLNRMGHSGKSPAIPYVDPADLRTGEWTYVKDENHAFYLRIAPSKTLNDYEIRVPTITNGVQIFGNSSNIVIKNLTVTRALNDGFGLTPGVVKDEQLLQIRSIAFHNIRAIDCCDDGLSAHADTELTVDGFEVIGCATGIASTGKSTINRLTTKNIHGVDLYIFSGRHVVTNSHLMTDGRQAPLLVSIAYSQARYPGWDSCSLRIENVIVDGSKRSTESAGEIRIDKGCAVDATMVTINKLSLHVNKGGSLKLTNSIVAGGSEIFISIDSAARWRAASNLYDIGFIKVGEKTYEASGFDHYQRSVRQDKSSEWRKVKVGRGSRQSPGTGADLSLIPEPNRSKNSVLPPG